MTFYIKQNDTSPSIQMTLTDHGGDPINLTGATVKFIMKDRAGNEVVNAAADVDDAVNGIVSYSWQVGDTDIDGLFRVEFEVTYADSTVETFPNSEYRAVKIRKDLG